MLADLRFALRQLVQAPGFTAAAILTLAVGIGSATVIFSAINALLFKTLPLIDVAEDRLLHIAQTDPAHGHDDFGWNYPDFAEFRKRATTLAGLWVHIDRTVIIGGADLPERQVGTEITWDGFALMGLQPALGRGFTAADAEPKAPRVALISAALWQRRFAGNPEVLGTTISLNDEPTTVIGVMPPAWRYPDFTDVWTPIRADHEHIAMRGYFAFSCRGRLKPGVTLAQAQAEANTIMGALAQEFPGTNTGIGAKLRPIREEAVQDMRRQTVLLFGAVMFVFLIACVNVANLLLARAVTRAKEFAIRLALGATRGRLVRQLATESLLLGLLGGGGGLLLGLWGNDAMQAAIPVEIPFWLRFDFDSRVFAFVLALSLVAALVFGLFPALRASRPDVVAELKEGGRTADVSGPRALQFRNLLVVAEVALALVLLVAAGLMMRSFLRLRSLDPGFDPRGVLTFRTGFPPAMFGKDKQIPARFFEDLLPRLAALPGVDAVAAVSVLPGKDGGISGYQVEGTPQPARASEVPLGRLRIATPGYFTAVRIPLIAGRLFDDTLDRPDTALVAVVDEAFARKHFGRASAALGRRLRTLQDEMEAKQATEPTAAPKDPFCTIVGVVGTVRHRLDRDEHQPTIYVSQKQDPLNFLSLVVRTQGDPTRLIRDNSVRDTVLAANHAIPIYDALPLEDVLLRADTVWPRRFFGWLFAVFGCIALFLACIGIYGVMSYHVTQRVQELGVRLALGAQPSVVVRMVLHQGLRLVGFGLAAGFAGAWLAAQLLTTLLYGVSPHDPPTFALVPLLLAAVAMLACYLPSRRATLIEPNTALRAG